MLDYKKHNQGESDYNQEKGPAKVYKLHKGNLYYAERKEQKKSSEQNQHDGWKEVYGANPL